MVNGVWVCLRVYCIICEHPLPPLCLHLFSPPSIPVRSSSFWLSAYRSAVAAAVSDPTKMANPALPGAVPMEQPAERAKNDAKEEKARQARQALIDALLSSIVHPEGVIDPAKMARALEFGHSEEAINNAAKNGRERAAKKRKARLLVSTNSTSTSNAANAANATDTPHQAKRQVTNNNATADTKAEHTANANPFPADEAARRSRMRLNARKQAMAKAIQSIIEHPQGMADPALMAAATATGHSELTILHAARAARKQAGCGEATILDAAILTATKGSQDQAHNEAERLAKWKEERAAWDLVTEKECLAKEEEREAKRLANEEEREAKRLAKEERVAKRLANEEEREAKRLAKEDAQGRPGRDQGTFVRSSQNHARGENLVKFFYSLSLRLHTSHNGFFVAMSSLQSCRDCRSSSSSMHFSVVDPFAALLSASVPAPTPSSYRISC